MLRTTPLLLGTLIIALPTASAQLGPTKLTKRIKLLDGRLIAMFPKSAKSQPRRRSVMSATEASTAETRVVIDASADRMVVMTWELFHYRGKNLLGGVNAYLQKSGATNSATRALKTADGLDAVRVTPRKVTSDREANRAGSLFVASKDGTVQMIAVFINNKAAKARPKQALALADKILSTVRGGKGKLQLAARAIKLRRVGKKQLSIKIPKHFALSHDRGPDFDVFRLAEVVPLGQTAGSFGVYIGGHPSLHSRRWKQATRRKGKLLGSPVEWHAATRAGIVSEEAMVMPEKHAAVHVFFSAPKARLKMFRELAASLVLR